MSINMRMNIKIDVKIKVYLGNKIYLKYGCQLF